MDEELLMEGPAFLPLPQGLRITGIRQEETMLIVEVLSERALACCPLCGRESDVVHSRYQRRLKYLPSVGQAVRLHLTVRKFFCRNPQCERRIFTERLPIHLNAQTRASCTSSPLRAGSRLSSRGDLAHCPTF